MPEGNFGIVAMFTGSYPYIPPLPPGDLLSVCCNVDSMVLSLSVWSDGRSGSDLCQLGR